MVGETAGDGMAGALEDPSILYPSKCASARFRDSCTSCCAKDSTVGGSEMSKISGEALGSDSRNCGVGLRLMVWRRAAPVKALDPVAVESKDMPEFDS